MPSKVMLVSWKDGADLSRSQKCPGDFSPLTRDGNNQLGQVTLRDVDEEDSGAGWPLGYDVYDITEQAWDPRAEAAAALGAAGGVVVVHLFDVAVDVAKLCWTDLVLPAIRTAKESTRNKFSKTREFGGSARSSGGQTAGVAPLPSAVPDGRVAGVNRGNLASYSSRSCGTASIRSSTVVETLASS